MPLNPRRACPFIPLAFACAALAQPATPEPPASDPHAPARMDLSNVPAPLLLGARVEAVRRKIPAVSEVVIVSTKEAFVEALARWSIEARFPILLDDDTPQARENIARFVRAYQPKRVVRWNPTDTPWPDDDASQRRLMADAVAKAWGAESFAELPGAWKALQFIPPGVVLLSESDPMFLGGLALAAGHGQIPLWLTRDDTNALPSDLSGELTEEQAATFRATLEEQLNTIGLPWNALGDTIDSITLAVALPGRIASTAGQRPRTNAILALSDYLGRHADGTRYAWTGLLTGDQEQSAYNAMCALFLQPHTAWMFNGYKADGGFGPYDPSPTRPLLSDAGITPTIDTAPFSGIDHWRRRISHGIDAGLIQINSSGQRRNFTLNPGAGTGADIPALDTPAIVHFVHSFSAEDIGDKHSIARRFLDNGAYAYVGSVDEPFLTAFHTPEQFVHRVLASAPLAAAARYDESPAWKINIYGDPLITLGPPAPTSDTPIDLSDAKDVDASMRAAMKARDFKTAAQALLILGRDADLARLYNAVRTSKDAQADPDLAEAAFSALFRMNDRDAMLDAARRIPAKRMRNAPMQDMLWQAFTPALSSPTPELAAVLRDNVRSWNLLDDAELAAQATSSAEGKDMARAFLERLSADAKNERLKAKIDELLRKY